MNRKILIAAVIIVMTSVQATTAFSYQYQGKTVEEINRETFDSWDDNRDGELNYDEYLDYAQFSAGMNWSQASSTFNSMDGDANGAVSFPEFTGGICCI